MTALRLSGPAFNLALLRSRGKAHTRVGSAAHMSRGTGWIARALDFLGPTYEFLADGQLPVRVSRFSTPAKAYWLSKWARTDFDYLARTIGILVKPGESVIDVGSLYGLYSYLMGLAVGSAGKVHAFEPNSRVHPDLKTAIEHLPQVQLHPVGAGSVNATLKFLAAKSPEVSSYAFSGNLDSVIAAVEVPVVRLDERLRGDEPSFCKIDVEGFEPDVVEGLSGFRRPPYIFTEKPSDHTRAASLLSLLVDRGYETYAVPNWTWRKELPLRKITPDDCRDFNWPDTWTDALAVPRERGGEFAELMERGLFVEVSDW